MGQEFSYESSLFHISTLMWNNSCNHREVTDAGSSQLGFLCVFVVCSFLICELFFQFIGFEYEVIGNQEKHNGKT